MVFVNKTIPANQRQFVPVYLGATAGMRLLPQASQDAIMVAVRAYLAKSGYQFQDTNARVISGQEEGAFGFMAVNYLKGLIAPTVSPRDTRLVIDVGGASAQITYVPTSPPAQLLFEVRVPGLPVYPLYTYSFLYYGNDQARNLTTYQFAPDSTNSVNFPCFNTGYSEVRADPSGSTLKGTSNYAQCQTAVQKIFNKGTTGTINGVYQAPVPTGISLSGIGTYSNLNAIMFSTTFSAAQLASNASYACGLTLTQLQAAYPTATFPFNNQFCFQATLLSEIATYAFGLPANAMIDSPAKIGQVTTSWTLGYMINAIGQFNCTNDNPNCAPAPVPNPSFGLGRNSASPLSLGYFGFILIVILYFLH